ncbi:MAG: GNAT family N-acetyltransferase [Candidatus Aegiribacteria sp.]|nr:GNAT family N-acetyltransferase [Candidatus Aegiribacteria sp.]MBD3294496.1 GNAT family N-acetyltransferase [Candidatus Fermentibacteria bacterium]
MAFLRRLPSQGRLPGGISRHYRLIHDFLLRLLQVGPAARADPTHGGVRMQVIRPSVASEFLKLAGEALLLDEVKHGLAYGIAESLARKPDIYGPEKPWFAVLLDGAEIVAAALRTPPYRVILCHMTRHFEAAADALVDASITTDAGIPGLVGERRLGEEFARLWCKRTGSSVSEVMSQRIYRLLELHEPCYSPGHFRASTADDAPLVRRWAESFQLEAVHETPTAHYLEMMEKRVCEGRVHLWVDEEPVSMALATRPTRSGITIGGVYTPPEHRRNGYATSVVAALTKELLRKYRFCMLYTDLDNPTSNSIYMRMGYQPHCDSVQYTFHVP